MKIITKVFLSLIAVVVVHLFFWIYESNTASGAEGFGVAFGIYGAAIIVAIVAILGLIVGLVSEVRKQQEGRFITLFGVSAVILILGSVWIISSIWTS
ncbi:MAG: hypothetical protein JWN89_514 [Parcubacteria group bacterium]|nr:hypothetical protein [Parcubacteria group bacterium]